MAAINCGTEALIFGNLMMFASGFFANSPKYDKSSGILWSSFRYSGNTDKILAASEMSFVSILIFDEAVNAFTIGRKE